MHSKFLTSINQKSRHSESGANLKYQKHFMLALVSSICNWKVPGSSPLASLHICAGKIWCLKQLFLRPHACRKPTELGTPLLASSIMPKRCKHIATSSCGWVPLVEFLRMSKLRGLILYKQNRIYPVSDVDRNNTSLK